MGDSYVTSDAEGVAGLGLTALATGYGFNKAKDIEDRASGVFHYLTGGGPNNEIGLGNELNTGSQFKGYGVTSGLGNTTIGNDGSVNLGVGRDMASQGSMLGAYNAADQMMGQSLVDPAARQQQIYNQAMAVQNPQLDRMQAQQQAREYAMGRGGIRGSLYGGTAEDAAMARARAEAGNQAYMMAQQQALAEQGQQAQMASNYGQLANQYNQTQYLPMQTQMQLMQLAGLDADRAQTGQLTGQGYLGQMGIGGVQTEVNAYKTASELRGNVIDSILDNIGGQNGLFSFLN
jgi:hypothetical protein